MWIWLIPVIAFLLLVFLEPSYRRVNIPRRVSPKEGIEDIKAVQAYDKISRWPQFRLVRKMIVGELNKYHPNGVLADLGCGPGYLVVDIMKALPQLTVTGVDISE